MRLAEIFVGVRGDSRELPGDIKRGLAKGNTGKLGSDEGHKFVKGFGNGLGKLAAIAGTALAGMAIGAKIKESIGAASDLNETVSKTNQVFGSASGAIQKYAANAPKALGQSKQAALDANATFGLFGKTAGLTGGKLVGFTTSLTTLASDMASFSNTTPDQAIEAIGAALRGESEPIRAYGVLLDDATLKAEAMSLGLVKTSKDVDKIKAAQIRSLLASKKYNDAVKEHGKNSKEALAAEAALATASGALKKAVGGTVPALTQQQKVLAAQSVILKQTKDAQGDFTRTSAGLANQQRIAAAQTNQLKVAIGNALLPVVLKGATVLNKQFLPPLIDLAEKHGPAVSAALLKIATGAGPALTGFFAGLGPKVKSFADGTNSASPALASLADSGAKLAPVVQDLSNKIPSLGDVLNVTATAIGFFADHTDTLIKLMPLIVAGIIAYKVAQLAANVAAVLSVPVKFSEILVNKQLVKSNRELIASRGGLVASSVAETVATGTNTGAKSVNILTTIRQRAATIAAAIAQKAAAVASAAVTAATWLFNAALAANPIGLVIVGIALLAVGLIALWKKSQTFRTIVTASFNAMKSVAITVIDVTWRVISGFFLDLLQGAAKAFGWVPGLGPKLKAAAKWFGEFRDSVNNKLAGLKDQDIKVTAQLKSWGTPELLAAAHGRATGGPGGPYEGGFKVRGKGSTTSDEAGLYALSNKEWVINAAASMVQGDSKMRLLNEGKASIVPNGYMAAGGKVRLTTSIPSNAAQNVAAGNVNTAVRFIGLTMAKQLSKNLAKSLFAPGLMGTSNWLKTQAGKPYGWGAAGPNAYDCSGLVSAAINKAYGKNPYSRLGGTGSMPWASMTAGRGPFMIGFVRGNPGHTAMTINGTHFESAGGVGVRYGPGARGADDGMFNHRYKVKGFARGGRPGEGKRGDAPFDLIDPHGERFLGKGFLKQMGIQVLDRGGPFRPGLAANLTGHNETVVAGGNNDGSIRLDDHTIRELGKMFAAAAAATPVFLDSTRVDQGMSAAAIHRGH